MLYSPTKTYLRNIVHLSVALCFLGFSLPSQAQQPDPPSDPQTSLSQQEEDHLEAEPASTEIDNEPEVESEQRSEPGDENLISSDDPAASQAQDELEGLAPTTLRSVPERMLPLQRAGWWTLFGGFVLATTGGVLAGFAEVEEDRAERLATTFDLEAGSQLLYRDQKDSYETILRRGNIYQWTSRGFLIAGAATLIAGIAILAVHGKRQKQKRNLAHRRHLLIPTGMGLEVQF